MGEIIIKFKWLDILLQISPMLILPTLFRWVSILRVLLATSWLFGGSRPWALVVNTRSDVTIRRVIGYHDFVKRLVRSVFTKHLFEDALPWSCRMVLVKSKLTLLWQILNGQRCLSRQVQRRLQIRIGRVDQPIWVYKVWRWTIAPNRRIHWLIIIVINLGWKVRYIFLGMMNLVIFPDLHNWFFYSLVIIWELADTCWGDLDGLIRGYWAWNYLRIYVLVHLCCDRHWFAILRNFSWHVYRADSYCSLCILFGVLTLQLLIGYLNFWNRGRPLLLLWFL